MTQPRRMPYDGTERTAFCEPGGFIAGMADQMEEQILKTAQRDIRIAEKLGLEQSASKSELRRALLFLVETSKASLSVAECRGERLEAYELTPEDEGTSAD